MEVKKYSDFTNSEVVNEEIFGAIGKFFGNMFKKMKEKANKVKGMKEVNAIYDKYLKMINDQLAKQADVELNIVAASQEATGEKKPEAPKKEEKKAESRVIDFSKFRMINEAEADAKLAAESLKKKTAILTQIVNKFKDLALKEMDAVLKKMGGGAKNPQLEILINSKKDQFDLDFLNAQITFLNKAGDKTLVKEMEKKRGEVSKKIEGAVNSLDKAKPLEVKEGDTVIYLRKDKKKEDYDPKKKPEEQEDVVAVNKLVKVDGDKYTIETEDGKQVEKTGAEIIGPAEGGAGAVDIKPGASVIYKRKKFDQKAWDELSDDDKKKPDEGKMKELQDKEMIGIKKVKELKGDDVSFEDADFTKKKDEIIGTTEGGGEEAGGDVSKKIEDLQKNKPEEAEKVSKFVDFVSDDKNKAKVAEIEKLLGGEKKEEE